MGLELVAVGVAHLEAVVDRLVVAEREAQRDGAIGARVVDEGVARAEVDGVGGEPQESLLAVRERQLDVDVAGVEGEVDVDLLVAFDLGLRGAALGVGDGDALAVLARLGEGGARRRLHDGRAP